MLGALVERRIDATPADRPAVLRANNGSHPNEGAGVMILATTKVEDIDRFLDVFSTKGAEKRAWALFDWDEEGWAAFVSDPDVPPILKAAGHVGKPQAAQLAGTYRA